MVVSPIRPRMSIKDLYDVLYMRILTGELRPGAAISETRIADEVGLSRTPVRQVFQRLADAGFLVVVPQVGTYVAPIEISAVRDAQFVREMLECSAVAEAATSPVADKEARLHRFLEDQRRLIGKGDHIGFFLSDEAMHRALMEIAGHPHVWGMIASAKVSLDRLRYLSLERIDWLEMIFRQHEDLVHRVVTGDPDGATKVMQAHLRTAFAAIERIAAENADFFAE
ncbi:GntR family transcriptional regulator [Rhizobium sp. NXC24]|uniref:GntR family transcriptional regulator n=1 Tax=Rhizobium sp. NXC24 TaxID=2048897 RepID=UPI000CDF4B6C|nr:GntR family transcriptional regulator [Rhizobium sp. NXC24]AVA25475.1 GntR family transcriptional regulator protein [Rhizobium sp. NXC24]